MSRKNDANKYWIYGEDAALAARFTKYLTKVLYARRASYIRDKMVEVSREISIEDCSGEVDDVYGRLTAPIEERVEAKLMWEGIRNYLPKLTPKECEVMPNSTVCCLRPLRTRAHRARKSTLCLRQKMYPSSTAFMSSLDIPYPRRFRLTEKTQKPAARRPIRC